MFCYQCHKYTFKVSQHTMLLNFPISEVLLKHSKYLKCTKSVLCFAISVLYNDFKTTQVHYKLCHRNLYFLPISSFKIKIIYSHHHSILPCPPPFFQENLPLQNYTSSSDIVSISVSCVWLCGRGPQMLLNSVSQMVHSHPCRERAVIGKTLRGESYTLYFR